MFVMLPIFMALGFAIGYAVKRESETLLVLIDAALDSVQSFTIALALFAAALIVGIALYSSHSQDVTLARVMIASGSFAVGFVAGLWFVNAKDEKDSAAEVFKFILGAGLLVVFAAIQYDTKAFDRLLDRIEKFSAPGISLELKGSLGEARAEGPRNNAANAARDNSPALRGGGELDFVVESLERLGEYALRDENYARLFSNVRPGKDDDFANPVALLRSSPQVNQLEVMQNYIRYNCDKVATLARKMNVMQGILRDEHVVSPVVENLIIDLKQFYFRNLNRRAAETKEVEKDLGHLNDWLSQESEAMTFAPPNEDRAQECKSFHTEPRVENLPGAPLDRDEDFEPMGFLALTISLLESVVGDREGAVQLLDREIDRQHKVFDEDYQALAKPEVCEGKMADPACEDRKRKIQVATLTTFRRLIMIIRLENTQDGLMDSWRTPATAPARLKTLSRWMDDLNKAYALTSTADARAPSIYAQVKGENEDTRCLTGAHESRPAEMKLIDRFSLARATAISNALETAALGVDLLEDDTGLRAKLDQDADYILAFDMNCLKTTVFKDKSEAAEDLARHFVAVAANYWETRAEFQNDDEDEGAKPRMISLCKSRGAFKTLKGLTADASEPKTDVGRALSVCPVYRITTKSDADLKLASSSDCDTPTTTSIDRAQGASRLAHETRAAKQGLKRVAAKMKGEYAAGDLDKFCPN